MTYKTFGGRCDPKIMVLPISWRGLLFISPRPALVSVTWKVSYEGNVPSTGLQSNRLGVGPPRRVSFEQTWPSTGIPKTNWTQVKNEWTSNETVSSGWNTRGDHRVLWSNPIEEQEVYLPCLNSVVVISFFQFSKNKCLGSGLLNLPVRR